MLRVTRFSFEKLFNLLKEKGIDDWQFAFDIGANPSQIMQMIHKRSVQTSMLNRLCDYLNVSLEDIMEHEELQYPNGVTFANYVNEHGFWSDLADVDIKEIRFVFHEKMAIDRIPDFRFIIEQSPVDIDNIMNQVKLNFDMNPDSNKYANWIVTDRRWVPVGTLTNPDTPTCFSKDGTVHIGGLNMSIYYSLEIDVTDPAMIDTGE